MRPLVVVVRCGTCKARHRVPLRARQVTRSQVDVHVAPAEQLMVSLFQQAHRGPFDRVSS